MFLAYTHLNKHYIMFTYGPNRVTVLSFSKNERESPKIKQVCESTEIILNSLYKDSFLTEKVYINLAGSLIPYIERGIQYSELEELLKNADAFNKSGK